MNAVSTLPTPAKPLESLRQARHAFIMDCIDCELHETYGALKGRGGDTLLELRRIVQDHHSLRMISQFHQLRPRLEKNHYLLGFRIRTWLSAQFKLRLSDPLERTPALLLPLPKAGIQTQALKRHFFEHAQEVVPLNDVRVEIVDNQSF